ncbi:hypothetical protein CK222_30595 [Mesorhizobium sp. WSM3866]|nr:hypothetical protein CK222_30595 [Mesorhizobium sp. WSM3866]
MIGAPVDRLRKRSRAKPCAICFCLSTGRSSQRLGGVGILGFGSSVRDWDATRYRFDCMFIANHLLDCVFR